MRKRWICSTRSASGGCKPSEGIRAMSRFEPRNFISVAETAIGTD